MCVTIKPYWKRLEDVAMEFRWISSLEKVFSDESLMAYSITEATALRCERFSVQCATYYDGNDKLYGDVAVSTDLPGDVRLYRVGYVPAMLPAYPWSDNNFLRKQPGVFPDPLFEQAENISLSRKQWRSLWIEAVIPEDCPAGCYTITLTFTSKVPWLDIRESTSFTVAPSRLEEAKERRGKTSNLRRGYIAREEKRSSGTKYTIAW